jgi:hypothetical protein
MRCLPMAWRCSKFSEKAVKGERKTGTNQSLSVLFWIHFDLRALCHETNFTTYKTKSARAYPNNTTCCSVGGRRLFPVAFVVVVMRNRAFMLSPIVSAMRDAKGSRWYRTFLNELPVSLLDSENLSLAAIRPYDTEITLLYTELNPGAGTSCRLFETCFFPTCQ